MLLALVAGCGRAQEKAASKRDSTGIPAARDAGGQEIPDVEVPASLDRQGEAAVFAYRFAPGDMFGYSIRNVERVRVTRDTLTDNNLQEVTYRYAFKVLAVNADGGATVEVTCLGVTFSGSYKSAAGEKTMSYDSEAKNPPQKDRTFALYGAPVRTPYELTIDRTGLITAVGRLDAVMRRYMGEDFKTSKAAARAAIEKEYGNNALKNIVQMAFQTFSADPVDVDGSWVKDSPTKLGYLAVEHRATYTLKGFSGAGDARQAHFALALTSRYMGPRKLDTGQGIGTIEEYSVRGTGRTEFDMTRGRSTRRKTVQSVFTKVWMEVPPDLKQLQPDMRDYWWITDGAVETEVEPISM
jgi:hypothetical protein